MVQIYLFHALVYIFIIMMSYNILVGHIREFRYYKLDPAAFEGALKAKETGLTHAALVGLRPQNVNDAANLTSYAVAKWMKENGHLETAEYIQLVAQWNEVMSIIKIIKCQG